ncbi:MAG: WG repeat-containing protein [Clostridia bacterium]|nr:WG repeat-containing protein [Clostridia bacterium]
MLSFVYKLRLLLFVFSIPFAQCFAEEDYIPEVKQVIENDTSYYAVFDADSMPMHTPIEDRIILSDIYSFNDYSSGDSFKVCVYNILKDDNQASIAIYLPSDEYFSGFIFDDFFRFEENLAPVSIGGKFGYLDNHGSIVIPPQWEWAEPFSGGYGMVTYKTRYGYDNAWINHDGVIAALTDPYVDNE